MIKKILCVLCAAALLLSFSGCGTGSAAIKYKNTVLTANEYQFYLSRYKAQILSTYNSGQDNRSFWTKTMDEEGTTTIADFFSEIVKDNIKINAICLALFDEYGLSLSNDVYASIESEVKQLIDEYGSRAEFNLAAAQFGVNAQILKGIYEKDAKIKAAYAYLYGDNGIDKVTDDERESYYNDNFLHIKTIFINTAYNILTDEDGNYIFDDSGYAKTEAKTEEEIKNAKDRADSLEEMLKSGSDFEDLILTYSEDPAAADYPDGFYFTKQTNYYGNVIEISEGLEEGQWGRAESEYGVHFVLRLPLEEKAYEEEKYYEFFDSFEDMIINNKFDEMIDERMKDVWIDEEVISGISLLDVPQNQEM
ncbi:MAG: peptidylprolyl isomerase [Clostridia bacterium]|nr:peptidylprolyl isomerase [Clostridia bacterium]